MTHKDFTNWLTGYLDGISEGDDIHISISKIKTKLNLIGNEEEPLHYSPQTTIPLPNTKYDKPREHIICDSSEPLTNDSTDQLQLWPKPPKGLGPELDNVYKDELI